MIRKLGLILECDSGGPDQNVLGCLVRRLSPETVVVPKPQGSKEGVYQKAAEVAKDLVEIDQCDLVLIVWDQKPLWKDAEKDIEARNCRDERAIMLDCLKGLPEDVMSRVSLLCISAELETWLLADDSVIREYLSRDSHPCKWKGAKFSATTDAKAILNSLCVEYRGRSRRYTDFSEAAKIARAWTTTKKLRKVPSFSRFLKLITGNENAEFLHDGTVCNDLCYDSTMMGR